MTRNEGKITVRGKDGEGRITEVSIPTTFPTEKEMREKYTLAMGVDEGDDTKRILESLMHYLEKMDTFTDINGTIFSLISKEKYETYFSYMMRRFYAAKYHYKNVLKQMDSDRSFFLNILKGWKESGLTGVSHRIQKEIDAYVYELIAFLQALRSAVDFLAIACGKHHKGITADSISTLMKVAEKEQEQSKPIFQDIKKHSKWLNSLRDHRDRHIHRFSISTKSGIYYENDNDLNASGYFPVLISRNPPNFIIDTRETRYMYDKDLNDIPGYSISEKSSLQQEPIPDEGYLEIDKFMVFHLQEFGSFFFDIVKSLLIVNFKFIASK